MNNTIIIEIETADTCFGLTAKFWKNGNSLEAQVKLSDVLKTMNRLTEYYNNTCNAAVMFTTK